MHVYPAPYIMIYNFRHLFYFLLFINFKQIWNIVTYLASFVVSFHFPAVFAINSTPIQGV
jgi:hypothetical protein